MPRTADPLAQKQKIVSAAIALYIDDRANFTIANIARKTRIKKVEIYNLFNSRTSCPLPRTCRPSSALLLYHRN